MLWDGRVVAGISRVSALTRSTAVVEHREGGDPSTIHRSPGLTAYAPITLERGVTHDTESEAWANAVWSLERGPGAGVSLKDFRKDVTLELLNDAGQLVIAYRIPRAWPSGYQALPELDAGANAVAIESLTLENEGWIRDASVTEPAEQSHGDA